MFSVITFPLNVKGSKSTPVSFQSGNIFVKSQFIFTLQSISSCSQILASMRNAFFHASHIVVLQWIKRTCFSYSFAFEFVSDRTAL